MKKERRRRNRMVGREQEGALEEGGGEDQVESELFGCILPM